MGLRAVKNRLVTPCDAYTKTHTGMIVAPMLKPYDTPIRNKSGHSSLFREK